MRGQQAWPQSVLRNSGGHRLAAVKDGQGTYPSRQRIENKTENSFKKMSFHPGLRKKINGGGKLPANHCLLKVCRDQEKHVSAWCQGAMNGEKGR